MFESNLTSVIGRVTNLRDVQIPTALRRALEPDAWAVRARAEAQVTLAGLASGSEKQFVDAFIKTLIHGPLLGGMFLRMSSPFQTSPRGGPTVQRKFPGMGLGNFDRLQIPSDEFPRFLGDVMEWVEKKKRWNIERDGQRTFENILDKADWIAFLLISPDLTPNEQSARDGFLPHIVDFIQAKQAAEKAPQEMLPGDTADTWLRAVLAAWRTMFKAEFPQRFREELRALRN